MWLNLCRSVTLKAALIAGIFARVAFCFELSQIAALP